MPDDFLDDEVEAERLEVWQERFAGQPPNREIIVAEAGDQLVGFACVVTGSDPVYGALLDNLHVASAYEGRGIGRSLIHNERPTGLSNGMPLRRSICGFMSRITRPGPSTPA